MPHDKKLKWNSEITLEMKHRKSQFFLRLEERNVTKTCKKKRIRYFLWARIRKVQWKKRQKKMWKKCANKTCKETHKQNMLRDTQQIEHD